MKPHALATCAAFVGRDWAEATHALGLQAAGTERREVLGLQHRPEALEAWGQPLRTRCNGPPVAVCLARHKGPIVSALRAYAFLGLFPVKPFTLAK